MNFTHYDLGNLDKGRIVEITLQGSAANVQLLDGTNFSNYKNGRNYRYIGGLAKRSPVRLQTTHSGHWHVAIDLRGLRGNVRSSVRVLPQALPTIHQKALGQKRMTLFYVQCSMKAAQKRISAHISNAAPAQSQPDLLDSEKFKNKECLWTRLSMKISAFSGIICVWLSSCPLPPVSSALAASTTKLPSAVPNSIVTASPQR